MNAAHERNGLAVGAEAGRVRAKRGGRKAGPAKRGGARGDGLKAWAYAGIGLSLALSAGLNGMAFAEHAPAAWAGWGLGFVVPVLVLVFARVSAMCWGRGWRGLAYAGGGACLAVLGLSVQHLAVSISRLTGEHVALAALMALAVDVGLVVCELATLRR